MPPISMRATIRRARRAVAWAALGSLVSTAHAAARSPHTTQVVQSRGVGTVPRASSGTIAGVVHDSIAHAPLDGATVLLTHATRADLGSRVLTTDSAGRFVAADVASGDWNVSFLHRALDAYDVVPVPRRVGVIAGDTTWVVLAIPAGAGRAPARGRARLRGQVRGPHGVARGDARVRVLETGQETTTRADGVFTFDSLPAGTWTVEARAVGLAPADVAVTVRDGQLVTAELALPEPARELAPVVVRAGSSSRARFMEDLRRRERRAYGRVYTDDDPLLPNSVSITQFLQRAPWVRVTPGENGGSATVRGPDDCAATVVVDGVRDVSGAANLDLLVRPSEVMAVEVHRGIAGVPATFNYDGGCVLIAIWTKR